MKKIAYIGIKALPANAGVDTVVEKLVGRLDRARYESWLDLRAEAEAAELRSDPAARHAAERRFGRIAKEAQRFKHPPPG